MTTWVSVRTALSASALIPSRAMGNTAIVAALVSAVVSVIVSAAISSMNEGGLDDPESRCRLIDAKLEDLRRDAATTSDIEKVGKRIDLHAQLMDYADLGKHWWCGPAWCKRTEEQCNEILAASKVNGLSRADDECMPRRNAYCGDYGRGRCVPVLEMCCDPREPGCLGVE
jgi:hypothetical protein